jgi:DNA-binding NarL/FixJ family response regulator
LRRTFADDNAQEMTPPSQPLRVLIADDHPLCLLDRRMPEGGGIAAAKSIRLSLPATKIILITALPDEEGIMAAARAGADGFLAKDVSRVRLPYVLRAVAEGETTYPRRLLHPVLRALQPPERSDR